MSSAAHQFHSLQVDSISQATDDAVVIEFAVPTELRETFRYQQGQHLTLRGMFDGEELRRNYSICASVGENRLAVGIRDIGDGRFSGFANRELKPGDRVDVMPPMGRFNVPLDAGNANHYVAFAAGSGITPILSILGTTLETEPDSRFTLVYGNRTTRSIMFLEELEDLKDRYSTRLGLVHVLSRESQDLPLRDGRIDADKVTTVLDHMLAEQSVAAYFICGPEAMLHEIRETLSARGVEAEKIHFELFNTDAPKGQRRAAAKLAPEVAGQLSEVEVILDGRRTSFKLERGAEPILDAAMKMRPDLPYACKGGMCCTCRARVVEGEVEMDVNYGLEPDEIAAGYVLSCQSHPVSERVVLDFDR